MGVNESGWLSSWELLAPVWLWLCFCGGERGPHRPHLRVTLQGLADLGRGLLLGTTGSLNAGNLFVLGVSPLHIIKAKVCSH